MLLKVFLVVQILLLPLNSIEKNQNKICKGFGCNEMKIENVNN
ncbi:MAG: hypothetical protein ACI4U3_03910 [Traorella sp.]